MYTGIIAEVHDIKPTDYHPKEIIELVDDCPIVSKQQLAFFSWLSAYYMCTIGEVINAALPAGLKISSESMLAMNPDIDLEELDLTEKERIILNHLTSSDLKMGEINEILNVKSSYSHVKNLKEKNAIQVFEMVKDKYNPKTENRIRLAPEYISEANLNELSESLGGKPKQLEVLLSYLKHVPVFESPNLNEVGVPKKTITEESSTSSLQTLIKRGVFTAFEKTISRIGDFEDENLSAVKLSPAQDTARQEILTSFEKQTTVLLHGVTGSGKTEIFISLIQDVIDAGSQVLYLLPEIALTTQIINRLSKAFGDQFAVFHSKYSDNERVEVWQKVQDGTCNFVVGVRSSIFLPFQDLSLIIVDEEHENSYKQYDPAPRYHARDAALYLAALSHAKTLLATATPSLESYQNALNEKYGLVKLEERFNNSPLPVVKFVNLIQARKQKKLQGNFTITLLKAIDQEVKRGKQAILFQNRRGYAPYLTCFNCGHIPKCPHCDVSLTLHHHQNYLLCHYCGHKTDNPPQCKVCQSEDMRTVGYGTEKIEEELQEYLPELRIRRMDLDTTRSKYGLQKIIDEFEKKEIDVLIGTQMVTKGLDFDSVTLVGVFDADRMIHFPDFRSHERAYQLIHQVSGRAGRREDTGEVLVQTNDPDQPILQYIKRQDYHGFYTNEILEREQFRYPPFYRLIKITIKDFDKQLASNAAQYFAIEIRKQLGDLRVIGPVEPMIGRIRNQYLFDITVKIEKQGLNLHALKEFLLTSRNILINHGMYKGVKVVFDVDPI